ncbi:LIM/homeobox protein Lhx3 isoform X2 [Folsomia candida]|nr:LIM/homeobox protein Lhx3 isoform X2 [Folsomia candida]
METNSLDLAVCIVSILGTLYCIMPQLRTFKAALNLTADQEQLCKTFTWITISEYVAMAVYIAVVSAILMKICSLWATPGTGQDLSPPKKVPKLRELGSTEPGKPARIRTLLSEKQVHTLRTCYAANPRPDALMKAQLVEMTGLSERIIRIWFQNKRFRIKDGGKDKKKHILLKRKTQAEEKDLIGAGIVTETGARDDLEQSERFVTWTDEKPTAEFGRNKS